MRVTFLGAAHTVTGSCYLVETERSKFIVDCGMFQGPKVEKHNFEPFAFEASEVDFMILTHAHLDHVGLIPKLYRKGFKGKIYLTPETAKLAELIMLDSAKIQEFESLKSGAHNLEHDVASTLLYSTVDALAAVDAFETMPFHHEFEVGGLKLQFVRAGHILGAVSVLITLENGKRIIFSGDIGRHDQSLIPSFTTDSSLLQEFAADYVVMESLYGTIDHTPRAESINKLVSIINETINRYGNVVIPSFAVHRTQEVLLILKNAFAKGDIAPDVQIILDSPLALKATDIYASQMTVSADNYIFDVDLEKELTYTPARADGRPKNIFMFDNLLTIRSHKQSLRAARKKRAVYIAGSGMAEGGRVLLHLAHNLPDTRNSIVFVGYQAEATRGRELVDGAKSVIIDKREIKVKAQIHYIDGFSAHAGNRSLHEWIGYQSPAKLQQAFLVHAEPERAQGFGAQIRDIGYKFTVPNMGDSFEL